MTLTFGVGALAVSGTVALSTYLFTHRFLLHEQEHTSLRQTYVNAAIVRDRLRGRAVDVPAILDSLTTGSAANSVIYRAGRWYSSSLTVSRNALPPELRSTVLHGTVERVWTRIGTAPVLVVGVPLPASRGAYFQAFDETPLDRTLSALRTVLLTATAATTAAGAAVGTWASHRLTLPLRTVTTAAARIAAGNLQVRLASERDADLAGLVDSFNTMVDTVRSRIERDARFAADVSHELRSPLTTLSTSLSVLHGRRAELSPRGRDALDLLALELRRFEQLVDDLLEISRNDSHVQATDGEPVFICQLVLNVVQHAPGYADVPVDLDANAVDALVRGDKRRLEQAVRNLLENAATYAGGVTGLRLASDGGSVSVIVDDAGPGVPPEDRERIFERFARGRNAQRRGSRTGTGLGLALVREHVRAHGGRVWVTDRPGGGSRFVVELPVMTP